MSFPAFIEEFKKTIWAPVRDTITAEAHPELHAKIMELCQTANIRPPREIFIIEEAFGIPNAMMSHKHRLCLGEKLLEQFGYKKYSYLPTFGMRMGSADTPVTISKELEAIIGHELGHSTRLGKDHALIYGTMTLPLLLFAGYKIYEHAQHRKKEKGGNINQHIEIASKELEEGIEKKADAASQTPEDHALSHRVKKIAMKTAKNYAILTAATLLALPITKLAGRNVEFAADRFGGNLVGNEHMASALKKLEIAGEEAMEAAGMPKIIQKAMRLFDYHPSIASRVTNLGR